MKKTAKKQPAQKAAAKKAPAKKGPVKAAEAPKESALQRLAAAIVSLDDPAMAEKFLREVLTPCEQHDLGLRWELLELMAQGVSQRQIGARLGISLCKITRGAKILKPKDSIAAALLAGKPAAVQPPAPVKAEKKPAAKPAKKNAKGTRKNGTHVAR